MIELDDEFIKLSQSVDRQHMEHIFANVVETKMFDAISEIEKLYTNIDKKSYPEIEVIPEEKMNQIAAYLVIQILITKDYREILIQIDNRLATHELKDLTIENELDGYEFKVKLNKNYFSLIHNQALMDEETLNDFTNTLLSHIWIIAINDTDIPFLTSDNPVVKNGYEGNQGF